MIKYYKQYIKCLNKYLELKGQIGGALDDMPNIAIGTVQHYGNMDLIEKGIKIAFENGCRHIDGANAYANANYISKMKEIINHLAETYGRENYWITWKSDNITIDNIREIIQELDCGYIDLWLVHHGCGTSNDLEELKMAREQKLVHQIGVSNCEDINQIRLLKENYNIYANQIQARPPEGIIEGRRQMDKDFISKCYKIGVRCMLFGIYSGILNSTNISTNYELVTSLLPLVNKYYVQKYVLPFNSVIMLGIGSGTEENLVKNIGEINNIENILFEEGEMTTIEDNLKKIELAYQ